MKTLLQILPSLEKGGGGVERGTLDIAKAASENGFESTIISSGGEMADKYKYKGVTHYKININKKSLATYISSRNEFRKILKIIRPDIVHIRSRWPVFCFLSILKEQNLPFATTYHGTYSGNDFFLKKKYNKLMTAGDNVISISKFIDNHIRYHFPECAHKLVQIDRGIDTSYFNIDSITQIRKENFLNNFSISEKTHIIILPGRITSWKGHLIAIDAVEKIISIKPELDFILVFVGSSQNRKTFLNILKGRIARGKLNNRIFFSGHLQDMPAVYSIADIILSTSIEPEAFGRVSAEASAMMKPIISSNHGGSREIVENNTTGWLVEPGNPEELAKKIIDVLDMPQEKKDLIGKNARKRIISKFHIDKMLKKTLDVYEELIEKKKKRSNN